MDEHRVRQVRILHGFPHVDAVDRVAALELKTLKADVQSDEQGVAEVGTREVGTRVVLKKTGVKKWHFEKSSKTAKAVRST